MILLGLLTNRGFKAQTVSSLLNLKGDFQVMMADKGYTTSENRNYLAISSFDYSHLLMIDDDMVFPPDTLERLLAHDKDIVGVAFHPRNDEPSADPVHYKNAGSELFECDRIGTGIILIKTEVFKNMNQPYFEVKSHKSGMTIQGEDWIFCLRAKEAGYKIWCDPTLKISHIGDYQF